MSKTVKVRATRKAFINGSLVDEGAEVEIDVAAHSDDKNKFKMPSWAEEIEKKPAPAPKKQEKSADTLHEMAKSQVAKVAKPDVPKDD